MLFKLIKCPKCNQPGFIPDDESTLDSYVDEFAKDIELLLPQDTPRLYPDFLICKCDNPQCHYIEKMTNNQILDMLKVTYAETAWVMYQQILKSKVGFDGNFTSYLYEQGIEKFIRPGDYSSNPWLRDVVESLQKEHAKLIKKS